MRRGYLIEDVSAWLESKGCRREDELIPHGVAFSVQGLAFSIPVDEGLVDPELLQDIMTNRWLDFGPCPLEVQSV